MTNLVDDFALALQLQEQFDNEAAASTYVEDDVFVSDNGSYFQKNSAGKSGSSLCDATWELIDPSPDAWGLFLEFNQKYFWGKLNGVELRWSKRMTLLVAVFSSILRILISVFKVSICHVFTFHTGVLDFVNMRDMVDCVVLSLVNLF